MSLLLDIILKANTYGYAGRDVVRLEGGTLPKLQGRDMRAL